MSTTPQIAPQITRPHLPDTDHLLPRDEGGYACHEVAEVSSGEFTGRVWRHVHRDADGTWFEFDATIVGLSDASGNGVGNDPDRLRRLAAVCTTLADELAAVRAPLDAAIARHPSGRGL
jgi:hypothetical protein